MKALSQSDAVIFLLSQHGIESPYVLGQIGSARAYADVKGQLLLPVIIGEVEIPKVVSDIQCFELPKTSGKDLDQLATDLASAVDDHAESVSQAPRIFVSHRHKEEPVAAALVGLLEAAFQIEPTDIRCTSVQPYALPPGERLSERLRGDVNGAELVIGLIGPDTADSRYVLFELGASWGRGVPTFPLLVRGANADSVPGPLAERISVSLSTEDNCMQLIDNVAEKTSLKRRQGVAGRVAQQARKLADLAAGKDSGKVDSTNGEEVTVSSQPPANRIAQHIVNYLKANNFTMVSFERIRQRINPAYSDAVLLHLIDTSPDKFRRANLKGKPGIAVLNR
jgi:hypothetical protein